MRFITLSEDDQVLVNKLEKESPNPIVRLRCNLLKLSNKKLSMKEISRLTDIKWPRIAIFFNAWEKAQNAEEKRETFFIKKGRGAKAKLDPVKEILPGLIKENDGNLNIVLNILVEKHDIKICKTTLHTFLKEAKL